MSERARICLVDDDIFVRDAIALGLRDLGYTVKVAPGAMAGSDLIQHNEIDALVTDLRMPGASGAQLIAEARARWPTMPIIAISGASHVEGLSVIDAARALGANALLTKPFRASELATALDKLLAQPA
ncbi:MAG TPA: response regulator [Vitreimonas sp.]|nr:response regulator [Vitreimonas sp.]